MIITLNKVWVHNKEWHWITFAILTITIVNKEKYHREQNVYWYSRGCLFNYHQWPSVLFALKTLSFGFYVVGQRTIWRRMRESFMKVHLPLSSDFLDTWRAIIAWKDQLLQAASNFYGGKSHQMLPSSWEKWGHCNFLRLISPKISLETFAISTEWRQPGG